MTKVPSCFIPFQQKVDHIALPERFTFPFYYEPNELSEIAAKQLQEYIAVQNWDHNFGLHPEQEGMVIGKMFGVLVVQSADGELGYLAAFSGKLAGENHHPLFVPPVFDMLPKDSFFRLEEKELNRLNEEIERLEKSEVLHHAAYDLEEATSQSEKELAEHRKLIKEGKKVRKQRREEAKTSLNAENYALFEAELVKLSLDDQFKYKRLVKYWRKELAQIQGRFDELTLQIKFLKEERKTRSAALQKRLFDEYKFLNAERDWKSLWSIFSATDQQTPPAGAGECAAPKLLQYAYQNGLKPIAMAEFWWGASPKSEVRKHQQFYPACRGKCEPILGHMLKGLDVDPNPMLLNPAEGKELEIIYEDEYLLAVNKPAEFLSVPGKTIVDSVYTRVNTLYPESTGPLIVHRLDMSTSGILILAKTKEMHKSLQRQFLKRTVKKRYVALLDGELNESRGEIELPLRVDLDNRPHQLVCYEHGKAAKTIWELIEVKEGKSRVYFYPITGRTHQLRVHAAHHLGLNSPIVGDDLYGTVSDRLHLNAERIEFTHPVTKELIILEAPAPF